MYLHANHCPLNETSTSGQVTTAFQDGLLLVEAHLPLSDESTRQLESLLQGMRETKKNEGRPITNSMINRKFESVLKHISVDVHVNCKVIVHMSIGISFIQTSLSTCLSVL